MLKSKWIQLAIVHNDNEWSLYIDGALQLDMNQLNIHRECPLAEESSTKVRDGKSWFNHDLINLFVTD